MPDYCLICNQPRDNAGHDCVKGVSFGNPRRYEDEGMREWTDQFASAMDNVIIEQAAIKMGAYGLSPADALDAVGRDWATGKHGAMALDVTDPNSELLLRIQQRHDEIQAEMDRIIATLPKSAQAR